MTELGTNKKKIYISNHVLYHKHFLNFPPQFCFDSIVVWSCKHFFTKLDGKKGGVCELLVRSIRWKIDTWANKCFGVQVG